MKKIKIILIIFLAIILIPFIINFYIIFSSGNNIKKVEEIKENYEYALILGCGIKNNKPSLMLRDRLDKGIELYNKGIVKYLIISGDHSDNYSEVDVMEKYLKEQNIPEYSIIRDNMGYSTSESLINYQEKYNKQNVIIVTQNYHMYRTLYISKELGINGVGVTAKKVRYKGQLLRDIREILARNKDFVKMLFN